MPSLQRLRPTLQHGQALASCNLRKLVLAQQQKRHCSSHAPAEPPTSSSSTTLANDHHTLGKRLNLFSVTPYSAGSPLLHADGSHLFLKLQDLLRAQHQAFGFREVISPTIYKQSLWEKSGHWQNYGDDMFEVVGRGARGTTEGKDISDNEKWGLKPMNCPGHCLLFATEARSYRDLPVRFADFSPLHRNEISGALSGLTRVRRFHQDDGHIFCRRDQVKDEIASTLKMVNLVYSAFELKPHKLLLSTRPEDNFIGTENEWAEAELQLQTALDESNLNWSPNPGDGAFYGPKIDIILRDNHGKEHQTATIQLDFQLPQRFELVYQDQTRSTQTPILIHRAVLGSIERFMALLIEHYHGKWPFWLNPHQVSILTLNQSDTVLAHANKIASTLSDRPASGITKLQSLRQSDFTINIDSTSETQGKKLVHARNQGYGILCSVGRKEVERGDVTVDFWCAGEGTRLERVETVIEGFVDGATKTQTWTDRRRLVLRPEVLKGVMEGLCEEWL